jgi:mgtE-like transporter
LRLEPPVLEDVAAYLVLSVLRVTILVLVGFLLSLPLGRVMALPLVLGLLGLAVLISAGILIPLTLFVTFRSFSRGYDPENVVGPLLTSSADVVSFLSIIIAAAILGV